MIDSTFTGLQKKRSTIKERRRMEYVLSTVSTFFLLWLLSEIVPIAPWPKIQLRTIYNLLVIISGTDEPNLMFLSQFARLSLFEPLIRWTMWASLDMETCNLYCRWILIRKILNSLQCFKDSLLYHICCTGIAIFVKSMHLSA